MNKRKVIEQLQGYLAEELMDINAQPESAERAERTAEIQRLLVMYKFLPVREYGLEDVVCPASLVELDLNGTRAFYFIVPNGGGLITNVDGKAVQVITPNSPLGEALLGRKVGESVDVVMSSKLTRTYRLVSLT